MDHAGEVASPLWVRLPDADTSVFSRLAAEHGVIVRPGQLASPDGGYRDHIRIAYGTTPDRLVEGVDRLGDGLGSVRTGRSSSPHEPRRQRLTTGSDGPAAGRRPW